MAFEILTYGDAEAETLLVQMVDDHDLEGIEKEISLIREMTGGQKFCLKAVKAGSWNNDLSPWSAPAVFGNEDFGGQAQTALEHLKARVLAGRDGGAVFGKVYLGGYSLAGLFALWAGTREDCFDGLAAASPSVWFPGFTDYLRENRVMAPAVYLSLGDREERTRNPVMARVGEAIRETEKILKDAGTDCILEWNKGNHFRDADKRTARAFAWLMNRS